MRRKASSRVGFFDGLRAFFGGAGFIVGQPSIWPWAAIPIAVATVLFAGFGVLGLWGSGRLADAIIGGGGSGVAYWALRILFALVALLVAYFVAATFAQPLSGFALDVIAQRQDIALGGRRRPSASWAQATWRALWVSLGALALSLPPLLILAVITFLFPPASVVTLPLKFVVTALAVAYDFLDYPLSLRGEGVGARFRFIRENPGGVLGFGLAAAVCLLVPGVGLFLLPFGVAGATRLVAKADLPS